MNQLNSVENPNPAEINQTELPHAARRQGAGIEGMEELDLERPDRLQAVREGEVASIHSWELVTAVDGPGTRLTIFFSGCPLRCLYCHNPDTFEAKNGQDVSLDEIVGKIKRYRRIFKASGGGITLSGGEVLQQPAFARRVLEAAKEMGVHTAIDTSGFLGRNASDKLLESVDLVLLDVKSGDPETYKKTTGRELQPTIDFGDRLSEKGIEVWARFVLVPELTDDYDNVEKVADIVSRWQNNVSRVEVLPFHQMGTDKWDSLGIPYQLRDTRPPEKELVDRVREQFRARGFQVY